jgi:O-antigen/teichoic acid export membrane protein
MSYLSKQLYTFLHWSEKYTKTDMVYLFKSGIWVNANSLVSYSLTFILSIVFANILPKEVLGTYQYLLSFSIIVSALCMTGMNYAVTQATARGSSGTLRASVALQLRWSIVPAGVSLLAALYYALQGNFELSLGLFSIGICIPITNSYNTYSAYLNGIKDFRGMFMASTLFNSIYYPSIILVAILTQNALSLVWINLFVSTLLTWYLYKRTITKYPSHGTVDLESLSYGKKLSISNLPTIIATQIDNLLVFHFLGAAPLALYVIATTIPEKVTGLFKFIFLATIPKYAVQNPVASKVGILGKIARMGAVATILVGILIFITPTVFHVFFPRYIDAIPYTQFYALSVFTILGYLPISNLIAQARKTIHIYNVVSPSIQIVLQLIGILLWGIWGILIARIIANTINSILAWILLNYVRTS